MDFMIEFAKVLELQMMAGWIEATVDAVGVGAIFFVSLEWVLWLLVFIFWVWIIGIFVFPSLFWFSE